MHRTEAGEQSERLLVLARGCDDFVLREQLTNLAGEWVLWARAIAAQASRREAYDPTRRRDGVS
jgi:hypothetical protein